jgi:hypothetical protein
MDTGPGCLMQGSLASPAMPGNIPKAEQDTRVETIYRV